MIYQADPSLINFDGSLNSSDAEIIRNATKLVAYDTLQEFFFGEVYPYNEYYSSCSGEDPVDVTSLSSTSENVTSVYPNPTSKHLVIGGVAENQAWELMNLVGELVERGEGNEIDLSNMASGIYILKVNNEIHRIQKL